MRGAVVRLRWVVIWRDAPVESGQHLGLVAGLVSVYAPLMRWVPGRRS